MRSGSAARPHEPRCSALLRDAVAAFLGTRWPCKWASVDSAGRDAISRQRTGSPAQTEEHLAEEVRNSLAALTLVQFSNDFDFGAAVGSGFLYPFTLQPIIPFTIFTLF